MSVQHPAIGCVLPHHLGVSLQQQVHSVLDGNVTNKNEKFTLLLCHLASILSRVVQGRLLPDVLDVGLRPGVQQLLDALEVAVLGGAVQSRLLVSVSEIHIRDTGTRLKKNPDNKDTITNSLTDENVHLTRSPCPAHEARWRGEDPASSTLLQEAS